MLPTRSQGQSMQYPQPIGGLDVDEVVVKYRIIKIEIAM